MKLKTMPSTSMAGNDVESSDREHLRPLKLRLIAEMMRLCGINYVSAAVDSYTIGQTEHIPAHVSMASSDRLWPGVVELRERYSHTIVILMGQLKLLEAKFEYGPAGEKSEWAEFWDYIVIGHGDKAKPADVSEAVPVPAKAASVLDKVPYDTLAACTPVIGVDYTVADHQLVAHTELGRFMRPYLATKLRQAGYALTK